MRSPLQSRKKKAEPANSPVIDIWTARDALQRVIRSFFQHRRYLEVDTPIAVVCPGTEVHLHYFKTSWIDHAGRSRELFLRSSPELHLKQALAAGVDRAFHLARCFRNQGELSPWHHPEFTMLEWYQKKISYKNIIDQTEQLITESFAAVKSVARRRRWTIHPAKLPARFQRLPVFEAFREFAHIELIDGDPDLAAKARAAGNTSVQPHDCFETAYFKVLLDSVEPGIARMGGAVLMDYPESQAALAVVKDGLAHRFEFYLPSPLSPMSAVVELCNGFEELLGEQENRDRIREATNLRLAAGNDPVPEDPDFYRALRQGLTPCCGNALGFDRLLALALGEADLDRVIPFRGAAAYSK